MESNKYSKNIFKFEGRSICDNCSSVKCRCDELDEEAGFVKSHRGKTAGKFVCKDCRRIPVQCKCIEEVCPGDEYGEITNWLHKLPWKIL